MRLCAMPAGAVEERGGSVNDPVDRFRGEHGGLVVWDRRGEGVEEGLYGLRATSGRTRPKAALPSGRGAPKTWGRSKRWSWRPVGRRPRLHQPWRKRAFSPTRSSSWKKRARRLTGHDTAASLSAVRRPLSRSGAAPPRRPSGALVASSGRRLPRVGGSGRGPAASGVGRSGLRSGGRGPEGSMRLRRKSPGRAAGDAVEERRRLRPAQGRRAARQGGGRARPPGLRR